LCTSQAASVGATEISKTATVAKTPKKVLELRKCFCIEKEHERMVLLGKALGCEFV